MLFPFIIVLLDAIYLYLTHKYTTRVLGIKKLNYIAMLICYGLIIFSYYYFIYLPKKGMLDAFLLGMVINGIYETTNWSIFEKWPVELVIMDTLWGGILFSLTNFFSNRFKRFV
jgi:uncharacterized membrane protein